MCKAIGAVMAQRQAMWLACFVIEDSTMIRIIIDLDPIGKVGTYHSAAVFFVLAKAIA